jgi:hypothetical protein
MKAVAVVVISLAIVGVTGAVIVRRRRQRNLQPSQLG